MTLLQFPRVVSGQKRTREQFKKNVLIKTPFEFNLICLQNILLILLRQYFKTLIKFFFFNKIGLTIHLSLDSFRTQSVIICVKKKIIQTIYNSSPIHIGKPKLTSPNFIYQYSVIVSQYYKFLFSIMIHVLTFEKLNTNTTFR